MPRTSQTHPLYIDSLPLANGLLGLTICPGKKGASVFGEAWERDLKADLRAIADWGADTVLTLIETREMDEIGVPGLSEAVAEAGMAWLHLPICDMRAPDDAAMQAWRAMSPRLHRLLEGGGKLLIHCRGGLGRAGTIAALLLIERGMDPDQAMAQVRAARPGAIETRPQECWLRDRAGPETARQRQVRASLLAGAIGDSLGADIEFLTLAAIRRRLADGLDDLPPHQGVRGAITDDTQMTLFTAEGLIRARVRGATKGICHPPGVVHHALLRWLATQGRNAALETDESGLVTDARLCVQRAPGNTCLGSLSRALNLGEAARNDSKGCGTIMRVAPVAFWAARDQVRALAVETSALTHGHATGQLAAAAWAEMLADVAGGGDLETAAGQIAQDYAGLKDGAETADAIRAALAAPRDGRAETVESLGGGWIAEEALAIALYASLSARDFEHGLLIAVTHGGDSDSTGAIAGNMLGLLFADQVFAHRWAGQVECADLITRLARDLCMSEARAREAPPETYPGW